MDTAWSLMGLAWAGAFAGPPAALWAWRALRRRPGLRLTAAILFLLAYGLGVWAFLVEPRMLVVRRVAIASPTWQGPPLRIGVLSDTHVGAPHVSAARVARTVARLSAEHPDVVLYVGDYAGGHEPAEVRASAARSRVLAGVQALGAAKAPLGQVSVLGNHDWWYDGPAIEAALRRAGVVVLENDAVRIARPGGAFWIAGVADFDSARERPSATAALARVPADEPLILLSHWPDAFPQVPPRVALTIAAHSHCGQVNLPFIGRPITPSPGSARWPCGLYSEGGRLLYVTGGLGVSILPVWFRAPPEIVVVTLSGRPATLAP